MEALARTPLLETKLRAPDPRPGVVVRPDLLARLDAAVRDHRVTLVSAAAGWGKSTLVGEWLAAREGAVAWLALDGSDNDPARFWRYLAEALRRAGLTVDDQAVGALAAEGEEVREAGLAALLNDLARDGAPAVIALDDLHAVTAPAVHAALAVLAEHLPEPLRLVLTSRDDPPIGLPRLRARGVLAELRSADLRFDEPDAAALLARAVGAPLAADQVAALRARTEGWAAGLYLAGLSLRGRDDPAGFIADFAGDDRLVVDYLAAEVLEAQPAARRDFMLRTAILGRMSGPLCDAVTGTSGSARVLRELESSNLFLVPLDSRREWYRYHHLFGELLRHELALADPAATAELHLRAAAWFRAAGAVDEAIHHAAAGGDLEAAADLIAENWAGNESTGWTATTERWLDLLPAERVRRDPRLCTARALIHLNLGRPAEAGEWLDAAEAASAGGRPPGGADLARAGLASGRSLQRLLMGDALAAVADGRRAVQLSADQMGWWRALALMALGIALHATGEVDEAYGVLQDAIAAGDGGTASAVTVVALGHLADADIQRGDLDRAEERCRAGIAAAEDELHAEYPHAAGCHANLGRVLAARGRHDEAREEAERGLTLARRGRAPTELAHAVMGRLEVHLAAGEREAAQERADEARALLAGSEGAVRLSALLERLIGDGMGAPIRTPDGGDLTERERAVLRHLAGSGSAREIAADLFVSHNTVKTQMRSIYRKLGVATRQDAVRRARERGLLSRSLAGDSRSSPP